MPHSQQQQMVNGVVKEIQSDCSPNFKAYDIPALIEMQRILSTRDVPCSTGEQVEPVDLSFKPISPDPGKTEIRAKENLRKSPMDTLVIQQGFPRKHNDSHSPGEQHVRHSSREQHGRYSPGEHHGLSSSGEQHSRHSSGEQHGRHSSGEQHGRHSPLEHQIGINSLLSLYKRQVHHNPIEQQIHHNHRKQQDLSSPREHQAKSVSLNGQPPWIHQYDFLRRMIPFPASYFHDAYSLSPLVANDSIQTRSNESDYYLDYHRSRKQIQGKQGTGPRRGDSRQRLNSVMNQTSPNAAIGVQPNRIDVQSNGMGVQLNSCGDRFSYSPSIPSSPPQSATKRCPSPMEEDSNQNLSLPSETDPPLCKKRRASAMPVELKDNVYWEKRKKNNEAAKRSRDNRRAKEEEAAIRATYLEQENLKLKIQLSQLRSSTSNLSCMLGRGSYDA